MVVIVATIAIPNFLMLFVSSFKNYTGSIFIFAWTLVNIAFQLFKFSRAYNWNDWGFIYVFLWIAAFSYSGICTFTDKKSLMKNQFRRELLPYTVIVCLASFGLTIWSFSDVVYGNLKQLLSLMI
jgi:hypothetical protein